MGLLERAKSFIQKMKPGLTEAELINKVFSTEEGKQLLERWYYKHVLAHKPDDRAVANCDFVLQCMELTRYSPLALKPHHHREVDDTPKMTRDTDFDVLNR